MGFPVIQSDEAIRSGRARIRAPAFRRQRPPRLFRWRSGFLAVQWLEPGFVIGTAFRETQEEHARVSNGAAGTCIFPAARSTAQVCEAARFGAHSRVLPAPDSFLENYHAQHIPLSGPSMDTEWNEVEARPEPPLVWEPIKPRQSHLYHWVRDADRRFARSFDRLLREIGIIASEWAALRELYRPQRWSPVELGAAIGMSKGGGSKLVSRLVAKGFAVKDSNESDRRFRAVGLTRLGRELIVFLAPIEKDIDREFFA